MNHNFSKIIGTGSFVPDTVVTNDDLSSIMDTSDEWIRTRTGIKERHLFSEGEREKTLKAALKAAEAAVLEAEQRGLERSCIDLVIVATCTPDHMFPATACVLTDRLGIGEAAAFDLSLACTGFLAAFSTASAYLDSGMYKNALIVGVDAMSKLLDFGDRSTSILFGDGAGAVVLSSEERFRAGAESGMIHALLRSDGSRADVLCCEAVYKRNQTSQPDPHKTGTSEDVKAPEDAKTPGDTIKMAGHSQADGVLEGILETGCSFETASAKQGGDSDSIVDTFVSPGNIYMNGRAVFEFAVREVPKLITRLLSEAEEQSPSAPKLYILHQANRRIIEAVAKRLKVPMDKFPCNIERYANTTAATIPMLLDELSKEGRLSDGDEIVMAGFGAGLSLGAVLFRW